DQPLEAEIGALSLATGEGKGYFLQLDDEFKDSKKESVLGRIKSLLEDPELKIMGHGLKTDSLLLDIQGIDLRGMVFDTMLASYLLKPSKRGHGLGKVAKTYLDRDLPALNQEENESLASEEKLTAGGRIVTENAKIAEVIWPLKGALEAKLQERDQLELLQRVEIPLIPVLKDMERKGIRFEPTRLEQGKRELQSRLEQLQQQIERLAGEQLNPSSPKQVREVLFDKLNLPVIERTKTGPSTNARVLEKLSDKHPLPEKVLEYREIDKLLNTYVNKLPDFVNEDTGRIHTSFNQTATATGRLSSSEPNLQNIPKGTETGKLLRKAFVPGPGKALIGADYSQIELRLLAHLSEDPELIETFQSGEDLHSKTAAQIYGVPAEEVTPQMRDTAKRVNFGIVYGITKYGLARDLGIEQEEAAKYIDRFFSLYPRAKEFIDEQIQEAEERKYAQTFLNRRRYLPNISSNNWNKRRHDQRNAINTPIQGGAADLMKLSMIEVHEDIRKGSLPGDLLLQVHDELILESPKDKTELACQKLRKVMEEVMDLKVPLKVDLKSGDNWGQL
ncbi:MAG: DNA polymerase I, partial [Candidatus Acetothermia bacterium]